MEQRYIDFIIYVLFLIPVAIYCWYLIKGDKHD